MSARTTTTEGSTLWERTDFPDFKGARAFVLPGAFYSGVVSLMVKAGFQKADTIAESDVVVFIGGGDIDPSLYNQKNVASGGISSTRDAVEVEAYNVAKASGKVMFGICRGAQLLQAMNGGELWQNVSGHGQEHWIIDLDTDEKVLATSLHHQMLMVNDDLTVVAVTNNPVSRVFETDGLKIDREEKGHNGPPILEVEAGAYEKTKSFFVQGHPEIGSIRYQTWCMHKLHDYYQEWTGQLVPITEVLAGKEIN